MTKTQKPTEYQEIKTAVDEAYKSINNLICLLECYFPTEYLDEILYKRLDELEYLKKFVDCMGQ